MAKKTSMARPGVLVAIGGAEDKFEEKFILKHFHGLSGGRRAHVAILPTASREEATGTAYHDIFHDFGVASVDVLPIFRRRDASEPSVVEIIDRATGVFITGGDQNKVLSVLADTDSFHAIQRANARGAVVGGTSAGASALSDPMIGGGQKGCLARSGMVKIARGLGLTRSLIIDQHFHQRERLGRLMYSVMLYPSMMGVGVDEDTAAVIYPDDAIEVIGRGTVTIVVGRNLKMFNPASVPDQSPMVFSNLELHTLTHGCRFCLKTGALVLERRAAEQEKVTS